jgi:hypothetical protein
MAKTKRNLCCTEFKARKIVCLCGSTKFLSAFDVVNRDETLKGNIVLSVGVDMKVRDRDFLSRKTKQERDRIKVELDCLHKRKIDMADEIVVITVDGQRPGKSTRGEIKYAKKKGKPVRYRDFGDI